MVDITNLSKTVQDIRYTSTADNSLGLKVGRVSVFSYNPNLNRALTCSRFNKQILCFSFDYGTRAMANYYGLPVLGTIQSTTFTREITFSVIP